MTVPARLAVFELAVFGRVDQDHSIVERAAALTTCLVEGRKHGVNVTEQLEMVAAAITTTVEKHVVPLLRLIGSTAAFDSRRAIEEFDLPCSKVSVFEALTFIEGTAGVLPEPQTTIAARLRRCDAVLTEVEKMLWKIETCLKANGVRVVQAGKLWGRIKAVSLALSQAQNAAHSAVEQVEVLRSHPSYATAKRMVPVQ